MSGKIVQFKAITPRAQVSGDAILSMIDGLIGFRKGALLILKENGIEDPQTDNWYPQQSWLDAFKIIAEKIGENTLYMIGTKIPENAKWPPGIDNYEKALSSIDMAYHMNHMIDDEILFDPNTGIMKEGIGHYGFEKIAEKKIKMVCDNPYPCDFDRGIIANTAKIFSPGENVFPGVNHDDSGLCRKNGDRVCNYIISWS